MYFDSARASASPSPAALFATFAKFPASSHLEPTASNVLTTDAMSGLSTGLAAHMAEMTSASRLSHELGRGKRSFLPTTESMTSCFEMFAPVQGIRHSMSSHSTIPRLYTSTLSPEYPTGGVAPSRGGSSISGAIHNMVPTGCHRPEKPSKFFLGRRGIFDMGAALPKSHIFARTRPKSGHHVSNTLLLLMSRCANPALCRYSNAKATSIAMAGMSSRGMSFGTPARSSKSSPSLFAAFISSHFTALHKFPPSQYSVTMNG